MRDQKPGFGQQKPGFVPVYPFMLVSWCSGLRNWARYGTLRGARHGGTDMRDGTHTHDVFISHNHAQEEWAQELARRLRDLGLL